MSLLSELELTKKKKKENRKQNKRDKRQRIDELVIDDIDLSLTSITNQSTSFNETNLSQIKLNDTSQSSISMYDEPYNQQQLEFKKRDSDSSDEGAEGQQTTT